VWGEGGEGLDGQDFIGSCMLSPSSFSCSSFFFWRTDDLIIFSRMCCIKNVMFFLTPSRMAVSRVWRLERFREQPRPHGDMSLLNLSFRFRPRVCLNPDRYWIDRGDFPLYPFLGFLFFVWCDGRFPIIACFFFAVCVFTFFCGEVWWFRDFQSNRSFLPSLPFFLPCVYIKEKKVEIVSLFTSFWDIYIYIPTFFLR